MNTTIFPFSLVRYASLHHQLLQSWTFTHDTVSEHASLTRLRNEVCDELYHHISITTDDTSRKKLLTLKRHIFNAKPISVSQIEPFKHIPSLLSYYNRMTTLNTTRQQFDDCMITSRLHLQHIAQTELLQNGLILSSPLLFEQLPAYIHKHPSEHTHKAAKIEFSLLRYITRMCFKTSPFSTFTFTGTMRTGTHATPISTPYVIKSDLKLNNHLFGYLVNIIKWHPILNEHLFVSINTTTTEKDDKIKYLINFNNVESFQQINNSTIIQLIASYFENQQGPHTLGTLITNIATLTGITSRTEIKQYLLTLCTTGYLELSTGISAIEENWCHALLHFFKDIQAANSILHMLAQLDQCRSGYASLPPAARASSLTQTAALINQTLLALEQQASFPAFKTDQLHFLAAGFTHQEFSAGKICYEDCYTTEQELQPDTEVTNLIEKIEQLLAHLSPADHRKAEKDAMRRFFTTHYPPQARISLTTFYHDYYRLVKKPAKLEAQKTPVTEASWITTLRTHLQPVNNTINLTKDMLFTPGTHTTQQSRGAFIQFFHHPVTNELSGVINTLLPGLGKVNGRFLSLFGEEQHQAFMTYNDQLYPDHIKAEIADGSIFNANFHPPLLPFQIILPGGNSTFPGENRISVNKIEVSLSPDEDQLELSVAGKKLYAFDLCLETITNRSNLYQLLACFNPDNRPSLRILFNIADELIPATNDITCYPRITFEDTLVLRRRTWAIRTTCIPMPLPAEPDFDYYCRLHTWRDQHQLPTYIFLFLRKRHQQHKAGLNDDYKPQLIHFQQPLLVELWKKLLQRAGEYIYLEEVLPDPFTNDTTVKEYLLQWYNY